MSAEQRDQKINSFVPLTLKLLEKTTFDNGLILEGTKLEHLVVISKLLRIDDQPNKTILYLDDGTGSINAIVYKKESNDIAPFMQQLVFYPGMYVNVVLISRQFKDQKIFVVYHVKEIKDFNEVSHHFLRVLQGNLIRNKGFCDPQPMSQSQISGVNLTPLVSNKNQQIMNNANIDHTQKVLEVVTNLLAQQDNVSFDQLQKLFNNRYSQTQLLNEISDLIDNGFIYESGDQVYSLLN